MSENKTIERYCWCCGGLVVSATLSSLTSSAKSQKTVSFPTHRRHHSLKRIFLFSGPNIIPTPASTVNDALQYQLSNRTDEKIPRLMLIVEAFRELVSKHLI